MKLNVQQLNAPHPKDAFAIGLDITDLNVLDHTDDYLVAFAHKVLQLSMDQKNRLFVNFQGEFGQEGMSMKDAIVLGRVLQEVANTALNEADADLTYFTIFIATQPHPYGWLSSYDQIVQLCKRLNRHNKTRVTFSPVLNLSQFYKEAVMHTSFAHRSSEAITNGIKNAIIHLTENTLENEQEMSFYKTMLDELSIQNVTVFTDSQYAINYVKQLLLGERIR